MKKKLVTLKEALPAMVKVFCRRAKGDNNVWNYAIKNDKCINYYIYFTAERYLRLEEWRYENDDFYTKMLEDIYHIVETLIRAKIPMLELDECVGKALGIDEVEFVRADLVMGSVLNILEILDVRKEDDFYLDFMDFLKKDCGSNNENGKFYRALSDSLSTIKDEPRWCADEEELSSKTQFEINHEAWADEFFGGSESVSENSSENVLTETEQTSLQLSLPPFKEYSVALIWKRRLKDFYGDKINTPLNCSRYNHILRCLVWFMEEWDKQGLLIKQPNRAAIQFLVETCGFKRDGVSVYRIAGVLGDLRKMTGELCEERELVRKYMESIVENT